MNSRTGFLIIQNNSIVFIGNTITELLDFIGLIITDKGTVEIPRENFVHTKSYSMKEYTKEEVINDIVKCDLRIIASILKIGIFKLERI